MIEFPRLCRIHPQKENAMPIESMDISGLSTLEMRWSSENGHLRSHWGTGPHPKTAVNSTTLPTAGIKANTSRTAAYKSHASWLLTAFCWLAAGFDLPTCEPNPQGVTFGSSSGSSVATRESRSKKFAPAFCVRARVFLDSTGKIEHAEEVVEGWAVGWCVWIIGRGDGVGEVVAAACCDRREAPVSLDELEQ